MNYFDKLEALFARAFYCKKFALLFLADNGLTHKNKKNAKKYCVWAKLDCIKWHKFAPILTVIKVR